MTRKKLIRAFSLTMALLLVISSTACTKKYDGKNKWIDSNLPENTGSLSGIRLEDDFAAATCADWLEKQTYDPYDGNGSFKTAGRIVTEKKTRAA